MKIPSVKICCISSTNEAELAIEYGASAIGLVSEMPSGPGVINEDLIQEIVLSVPSYIHTFLLTSKQNSKSIIEQVQRCKTNTVQIVDELLEGEYGDIREALPEVQMVQVLHVNDMSSIDEAVQISKSVDAILLDSGNQKLEVKELGGTGRTHDWTISKKIVEAVEIPVYLAGGISASNVVDAYNTVLPYGIDLCSSVRTNSKLDEYKLSQFFQAVNTLANYSKN